MRAGNLSQGKRTLISKIRTVDEIAVPRLGYAGEVEVDWKIEIAEIGGNVSQAGRAICVDKLVNRPLPEIGAQVTQSHIENRARIEYVRVADGHAQVLVV